MEVAKERFMSFVRDGIDSAERRRSILLEMPSWPRAVDVKCCSARCTSSVVAGDKEKGVMERSGQSGMSIACCRSDGTNGG